MGTLPSGTTVSSAESACTSTLGCVGFTFDGPRQGPSPGTVYLKNATAVATFLPDPASPWTSYFQVEGPCDILFQAGTPCVAAYSVVRALYSSYTDPLYAVLRSTDDAIRNISTLPSSGAVANASAQDEFCAGAECVISIIYDQSSNGNHLTVAPQERSGFDLPVNASRFPISINGFKAYGAFFEPLMGYRCVNTTGIATGNDPEIMYFVIDGTHYNDQCCFDMGNAGKEPGDYGDGSMEALYWGSSAVWSHGFGEGPWCGADLENGIYYGSSNNGTSSYNPGNMPLHYPFVFAELKGGTDGYALKAADATQGKLQTMWDGPRPSSHYQPMQKRGGIILGTGGDNSRAAVGTFFEGVMTSSYTTDDTDDALQRNVVSAGYGL